jgi:hypothetical protein
VRLGNAGTSLALVVLAIGSAGYAYFVDRGRVSDAERDARRTDVFPAFRADQVRRIEMVHGGERLVLETAPTAEGPPGWLMLDPLRERADPAAVDVLLRELEMANRVREVSEADAVGLDAPRARGTIAVGPLDYRFALGADALVPEGAAYLRVEGEGTFVVERSLKVQLLRGADAYRQREIVPFGGNDVARIEVGRPGEGVLLVRRGTAFRVGGDNGLRASRSAVDHLLGALAEARAEAFVDDAIARRAAVTGQRVVVASRPGVSPTVIFVVGGACPLDDPEVRDDVVVVRELPTPMAGCVSRGLADALAVGPAALVDDSPFASHADEIEAIRLEPVAAAGPTVDVARRAGGWHERAPAERDIPAADSDSTGALAAALADARALDVRPAAPGERFVAHARATIQRTGGGASEVLELGAADAAGVTFARRVEDGAILRLARETARRFEAHPVALSGATVWPAPVDPGAVTGVDDTCSRAPTRIELDEGVWKMRAGVADNLAASDLAERFARARADAWVAEADDGTFGLGRDGACTVTLTLASSGSEPPRRLGIVFGAPTGESGVFARTADGAGVFIAPAALRALASRPPVDRGALRVDLGALARVALTRGGARIVLGRDVVDGGVAFDRTDSDAGVPETLESALEGLRAEWALHTGPATADEGFDRPTLEIDAAPLSDASAAPVRITIGAPARDGATDGYFARAAGVDATFLVRSAAVHAVLDAW